MKNIFNIKPVNNGLHFENRKINISYLKVIDIFHIFCYILFDIGDLTGLSSKPHTLSVLQKSFSLS